MSGAAQVWQGVDVELLLAVIVIDEIALLLRLRQSLPQKLLRTRSLPEMCASHHGDEQIVVVYWNVLQGK
jgi:hypothetical protein